MSKNVGYSGTPLVKKLGFSRGESVYVEMSPGWYTKFADDNMIELSAGLPATHAHMFFDSRVELADFLKHSNLDDIEKSLWASWPKKSSGVKTDISEQDFRDAILPLGWVDTKVAAIDDTWSGLKFLRRKA